MPRSTSEHQAQKIKSEHSPTISCSYVPLSPAQPVCPYSTPAIPLLCRKGQTSWLEHGWVCCRHCSPPPAQTTWLSSGGLGRRVEIRTQQPRGTNCYSHCTLCKAQEMGQEMAQLDITCAPLGTAWPLPGHCCSLQGQGWAQTASLPPQWMCPRSNVHTRVTKCWLNPHWHMPLIFQKLVGIEGRAQERWGLCQGENHSGCVHSVPSSPSSADQRSMGRVCCYLQCHLWAGEGKTHGLMVKHDPLNESLQSRLLGTENPSQVNKQAPCLSSFPSYMSTGPLNPTCGTAPGYHKLLYSECCPSRAVCWAQPTCSKMHWAEGLLWHPAFYTYSIPTS